MHTWKSVMVCIIIAILSLGVVYAIYQLICILRRSEQNLKNSKCTRIIIYCTIALFLNIHLWKYTNPCDQTITPTLFYTVYLEPGDNIPYPGLPWHAVYEQFGLYASSLYINPADKTDHHFGFTWPGMDFTNHTYIVSYGWEVESLTYNIWETIDYPIRTGACAGYIETNGDFQPQKVFIYELPKIRVDHDINND